MNSKKATALNIVSGVIGLSTMLMAQTQFDSTQKVQKADIVIEKISSKDSMGTFGTCGLGMGCSGGGGQCGLGMGCGGQ